MSFLQRTVTCGFLRPEHSGNEVVLNGWIHRRRDFGSVTFLDIRDRYGITQVIIERDEMTEIGEIAKGLRAEFVVAIKGTVRMRENPNLNIPTGLIEVVAQHVHIVNKAEVPIFEISDENLANEELRLKYRYLDLRRPSLQKNFIMRNKLYQLTHRFFAEHDFIEVETPILTKSTPEGARDYLVPSRVHNGLFYALPQSPQLYKQLLMIAGFDRYMQIVKCFRDEDLRADRQPEFTQIDVEMSFIEQDTIINLTETFIQTVWKELLEQDISSEFPRMSFHEAMNRFGSDKPDTRYSLELTSITHLINNSAFKVFQDACALQDGAVIALNAKQCAGFSRKQIDELTDHAKKYGAGGLAWIKWSIEGDIQSPIAKFLTDDELQSILSACSAQKGDMILIAAGEWERACIIGGALRTEIAKRTGILDAVVGTFSFLWITEFPLLEFSPEENRYIARHHPFTAPMNEDVHLLDSAPEKARAKAHDLVINGYEVAGGSIRIHQNAVQQRMFDLLGFSPEESESKFGFLLSALQYGAPPHGGIAFGFDRLSMLVAGTENIRDVVAFPKTTSAYALMEQSPSQVAAKQLGELGINVDIKK